MSCNYVPAGPRRSKPATPNSAFTLETLQTDSSEQAGAAKYTPSKSDELELFHHFFTWTYEQLATPDSGTRPAKFWREVLPVMAAKHEYLLQSILSFTAFHVAYLRPHESAKYREIAVHYRDQALMQLPQLLGDLPVQTESCFWTSCFIGLITLADHNTNTTPLGIPRSSAQFLLELAALWRGGATISYIGADAADSNVLFHKLLSMGGNLETATGEVQHHLHSLQSYSRLGLQQQTHWPATLMQCGI